MEDERTIFIHSRFNLYELGLLLRLAEKEQRRKSDVLRECLRRECMRQGLIEGGESETISENAN